MEPYVHAIKLFLLHKETGGPGYARTCYMCCISEPQLNNQGSKGRQGMVQDPETKGGYLRNRTRSRAVRVSHRPQATPPQHYSNAMQAGLDTGQVQYAIEKKNHNAHLYISCPGFLLRKGSSMQYGGCLACLCIYED